MRKHATTKLKISKEMTRVAKCPFKMAVRILPKGKFSVSKSGVKRSLGILKTFISYSRCV